MMKVRANQPNITAGLDAAKLISGVVIATLMWGCAGIFDSRPPEEIVAERASAHLEHLRLQEWDKAIKYTSKAFRSANSAQDYGMIYRGSVSWLGARIGKVECDAPEYTKCKVGTYVTTKRPQFSYSNERYRPRDWLFIDGQWYIYESMR